MPSIETSSTRVSSTTGSSEPTFGEADWDSSVWAMGYS
jgi:hypothetical protein